jgi:gliding motility-associated-like protein
MPLPQTVKNILAVLVVFLTPLVVQAETSLLATSFTTNPAAVNGTVTICRGQSITYTDTSTAVGTNPTYAWSFPGGTVTAANTAGPHTITYPTAGNYTTILAVNGSSTSLNVIVTASVSSNPVITVTPNIGWVIATFNNANYFNYCADGSTGGLFLFSTNSTNTNAATIHSIDWGDGSPISNYTGSNVVDEFHAYGSNGLFQITYTVVLSSGCSATRTYNVFIGANPSASIINYGVPVLCNPGSVQYNIIPGGQNTPGTIYTFQVNDNSPPQTFTHAQVTAPGFTVTHVFNTISCGTSSNINGTVYPNSFQASITTSNPCGSSSSAIGPIHIQSKPIASISANPTNSQICVNTAVLFTDSTTPGTNIGSSPTFTCSQSYKRYWQITGPAGILASGASGVLTANPYVTVVGNLGFNGTFPNNPSIWSGTATTTLNITFNLPGTYSITLFTSGANSCGITSSTRTICVNPEVIADFTASTTLGCAPTTITLDNLSSVPGCSNTNVYNWQVTPSNPDNCPSATSPGWSFTSGTASSFEPEITFTSPGVYSVQLTTSLQNAVAGPMCQPDSKTRIITIKDKPRTTLVPQTVCEGTTFTLNPTVFNCYATQAVSYVWDFGSNPPMSISSTTIANPVVMFASAGTYTYTLTLTNECGSSVFSSSIVVNPAVQISASGLSATCINTPIPLSGAITGGTTSGTWTASITGGTFSPSATTLSPTYTPPANYTGTITFTLTSADPVGPCPAKTVSFPVVVNAQATAEAGTYNAICINSSIALNGAVGGAATTGSWTSSNGGTFSNPNSLTTTYTPPTGFIGTIVLTLTTNDPPGPCNPETDTVTLTVLPTPTINAISNVVICHSGTTGPIAFTGTNATNYSWINSNPAIGLAASGTNVINFTGTNTSAVPITATITVTPYHSSGTTSCSGTATTFTITVNPAGQVNALANVVVCHGDSVSLPDFSTTNTGNTTTYSWTSSNSTIGLAASGVGNIGSFTAINSGTAPVTSTITVRPTNTINALSCVGTPRTFSVTVNPTAQVTQPNNVVLCAGTPSNAIPFTTQNTGGTTTYTWTNNTSGIGLNASGTGSIPAFTPINTSNSPIVATITVTPTFSNGGTNCTGPSKTFTLTINPAGQVNTTANIAVCHGTTIPSVLFSTQNTGGTTTFNWTNTATSIGLAASGTGDIPSFTATNTGNSPVSATITVTPIFSNSNNCSGTPMTFTITVNPAAKVTTVSHKTICNGNSLAAINFATTNTGGTSSYTWTNDTPGIGLAAAGTGNIGAFTAVNTGTSPIIATIVVTPSYTNNSVTCTGAPTTFTITVNPTAQVNPIANQILCNGTNTTAVVFSTNTTGGTTTYNWTNSNSAIGLPSSGTGNINAFIATNTSANPITATLTVTPTFSNGTPTCSGPTQSFTITVNPSPTIAFSPANQTICSGDTTTLVNLTSTTTGAALSWTAVQPTGITGVVTSGTHTIPAQTLVNTTNAPITITYAAVAATNDTSACAGSTFNYTIVVTPRPSITESFANAICSGGSFSITPVNSSLNSIPVGTTYSWSQPVVSGGISGGASGTNQTSIGGTLINPTHTVQTATYTITPVFNNCTGTAFTVVISVNPKPVIANITPAAICSETAFSVTPTNGSGTIVPSGTSYTWTISANTNITGASASTASGISTISQTLTNTSNTAQTIIYTVTPTSGVTGNCVGSTFTITVVVNPKPVIAGTIPIICSGTAFSGTPTNGSGSIVPAGTTYTWTTPVSIPLGAITGGTAQTTGTTAIGQILTNTTTAPATLEYTVTPTAGTCSGTPFTISVTVNPTPSALGLSNQTYCNGVATSEIVFTNNVAGTTYAWTNSNTAIGLGAAGNGNIPVFTTTNSGTAPITATITVIATANGCSRTAETFTITVNPSPVIAFSPANQTICSGDTTAVVNLTSATSGATLSWTAVQPAGITGVITSGTHTIPAQTLVNTTNAPITITYAAVAATNDASACAGSTFNYTIVVNPRPAIENQTILICSEQSFTLAPANGVPNASTIVPVGTTYSWTISNNSNITGASAGTDAQISQILTNSTATIQTLVYTVTPSVGSCSGNPFTITVTVYPKPNVVFDRANQVICNNTTSTLVQLSSSLPGAITLAWTAAIPTGISGAIAAGTNTIPAQTLLNTTNTPLTITYSAAATFTSNGNSCTGITANYTITVNPAFTANGLVSNYNGYNVSVFGGNDGTINLTVGGGSGTYSYSWVGPGGFSAPTEDLSGLTVGTYTVTITDGYCAPIVLTFTLTQPPELRAQQDPALTINVICFGNADGALGIQITQESVSPYIYQLYNSSNTVVQSIQNSTNLNPQFTGLRAGTYSVVVTDANGGRKIIPDLVVTEPSDIVITPTITEITCYGANNASINLNVTGGTGPYQANWSNLATGFFQNNLAAGNYTITITDANGCTKPITIPIVEAPIFSINPVVTNISCFGANNGSINLNLIGGIAPVSLTWNDGSTAGAVRNNLGPGTYTVAISDGTPCYINRTFIIVEPQPLALNATIQNALDCFNASSGAINLVVAGGTPPFTYAWSNGATTEDLNAITNGSYSVVVTDSRGCTKTGSFTVSRPIPLSVILEQDTQINCPLGIVSNSFEAQVSGGMSPFQISWSTGTVSGVNNQFMTTTQNGLITVTITDANGCTASQSVTISNPIIGNPGFGQNSFAYTTYGLYSINDPIQFTNTATGSYVSVAWNFGDGIFSTAENPIHTYVLEGEYVVTQTVTYPLGCIKTNSITLIITKGYKLIMPNGFTANSDGINDIFKPEFEGLEAISLQIYDTWGNVIYSEKEATIVGWDGKINGVPAENGNYYYKVTGTTFYGEVIEKSGPFTLIK